MEIIMVKNTFGRTSELHITTASSNNTSFLEHVYFTAPLKVMNPIYPYPGYMQIIQLAASAGLMAGDCQNITIHIKSNCRVELTSQAYEKIHKMEEGFASRNAEISVDSNSFFYYNALPAIPFAGSAFQNHLNILLKDESSKLMFCDILSCGRYAAGERFQYQFYKSLTTVHCKDLLIYRDLTDYRPEYLPMAGLGFFEGYHVLANITLFNIPLTQELIQDIQNYLEQTDHISGGITRLEFNGFLIKVFAYNSQMIEHINSYLFQLIQKADLI